jgi:hypothetical protein
MAQPKWLKPARLQPRGANARFMIAFSEPPSVPLGSKMLEV